MKTGLVTLQAEVISLAWLLVLTKLFASLVSRIADKQTNYMTDCQATRTTSQTLKAMQEKNLCLQGEVWWTHCRMAFITGMEH